MRKGIHPEYVETTVTCGCGETFITRSTKSKITIEICSKCHPFYTGTQKFVDSAGRVERFKKKFKWSEEDSAQDDSAKAAGDSGTDGQSAVAVEEKPENNSSAD